MNLLRRAGKADKAVMEGRDVIRQHFIVALRIDRDENRLDTFGVRTQDVERLRDGHQICWARRANVYPK